MRTFDLQFPLGGLDRKLAFQSQRPFTTPDCLNVFVSDVIDRRMRGGSRPGLVKSMGSRAAAAPVHLLTQCRVIEALDYTFFFDDFATQPGLPGYSAAPWSAHGALSWNVTLQTVGCADSLTEVQERGYVHTPWNINTTNDYWVEMYVLGHYSNGVPKSTAGNGVYDICVRMDNTNSNVEADGVVCRCDPSNRKLSIIEYVGGVSTVWSTTYEDNFAASSFRFRAKVSGNTVTVQWVDEAFSHTVGDPAGSAVGIDIVAPSPASGFNTYYYSSFRVDYTAGNTHTETNRNSMISLAGAATADPLPIKFENTPNVLVTPGTNIDDTTNSFHLQASELLGKTYIVGDDDNPVWEFDPTGDGSLVEVEDSERNVTSIATYLERIVVAGQRTDPHNWFMSKAGDATNWSYGTSPGDAVAGNTAGISAGKLPKPITALVTHSHDYLVFASLSSLYVLLGDPTIGGRIDKISESIGIVSASAWSYVPGGGFVFVSHDGLYFMQPGRSSYPESLSREKIPKELIDIDTTNKRVLVGYTDHHRGVFVGLWPKDSSAGTYWWFDWENRSFLPISFPLAYQPTTAMFRDADAPSDRRLVFGCQDGYLREFDDQAGTDDGSTFATYVDYGPIPLNGGSKAGNIDSLEVTLDNDSADVSWSFRTGRTAQEAFNATARATGRAEAGANYRQGVRAYGTYGFLRLSTSTPARWAVESIKMRVNPAGEQRKF